MKVLLPSPLRSYTGQHGEVQGEGSTLATLLEDLDRRYPGLRFRVVDERGAIRPHIKFFVNRSPALGLEAPLAPHDEVLVVAALSGG